MRYSNMRIHKPHGTLAPLRPFRVQQSALPIPGKPVSITFLKEHVRVAIPTPRDFAEDLIGLLTRDQFPYLRRRLTPTALPADISMIPDEIEQWASLIRENYIFPEGHPPLTIHPNVMVIDLARRILETIRHLPQALWPTARLKEFEVKQDGFGYRIISNLDENFLNYLFQKMPFAKIHFGIPNIYKSLCHKPYPAFHLRTQFLRRSGKEFALVPDKSDVIASEKNPDPVGKLVIIVQNERQTVTYHAFTVAL